MGAKFCRKKTLSWSQHIYYIINKLSVACYAIRNIKYTVTIEMPLRLIYFAHVHGIIFRGSASLAQCKKELSESS
jgi:hypothetical protein